MNEQPAEPLLVLVVEDEPILLLTAAAIVEEAGFRALEAGNADDALHVLSARSDIAAVFTDVTMPGSMDGLALAAVVRDRWPHVGVLLTSGNSPIDLAGLPNQCEFLIKPYVAKDVARILHGLLED